MSIYGTSVDAILICYAADMEISEKTKSVAKNVPETLKTFLDDY